MSETVYKALFVGLGSSGANLVVLTKEIESIRREWENKYDNRFTLEQELHVEVGELAGRIQRHEPQILHISGFGDGEQGALDKLEVWNELFALLSDGLHCVVLHMRDSAEHARSISARVNLAIGVRGVVEADAARGFATGFYNALRYRRTAETAFELGKLQACFRDPSAEDHYVFFVREGYNLTLPFLRALSKDLINFDTERARHQHFFGREDIFDRIDKELAAHRSSWIVISGGPGLGKSALVEKWLSLRERDGRLTAYHFIRRGVADWDRPAKIRANLAAQIEEMFPDLAHADADPATRLENLLDAVGKKLEEGESLVLLVDGLDEAATSAGEKSVHTIFPHELPPGVSVVVASRPAYRHLSWFGRRTAPSYRIDLDKEAESNHEAVRLYWEALGPKLEPSLEDDDLRDKAIDAAEGNLLHAVKLRELWARPEVERSADSLPRGFAAMLERLWERICELAEADDLDRAVTGLALLCAAKEPMPLHVVGKLLAWRPIRAKRMFLPMVREMVLEERGHEYPVYRPFHEGLREFVARELPDEIKAYHAKLASLGFGPLENDAFRQRYRLRHRLDHLVAAGILTEAKQTAVDIEYLTLKAKDEGALEVERDIRLVADALPKHDDDHRRLKILARVVAGCSNLIDQHPEALARLVHDRLLSEDLEFCRSLSWPPHHRGYMEVFPRLRHPLQRGSLSRILDGHTGTVTSVAVWRDERIISGSYDGTVRVWDVESGAELHCIRGHTKEVWAVAVLADGRVVSGSGDRTVRVWDKNTGRELARLDGHGRAVHGLAVLPDGGDIVSASRDGTLRTWDQSTYEARKVLNTKRDLRAVDVLPSGLIICGAMDGSVEVWDPKSDKSFDSFEDDHNVPVWGLAALDEHRIVSASQDSTLKVRDRRAARMTKIPAVKGHEGPVRAVAKIDERRVVSASIDRTLRIWNVETRRELTRLYGHRYQAMAVATLGDGRIVSGSVDRTVRIWDRSAYEQSQATRGHRGRVRGVAMLPDGRVASCGDDAVVRVWDPHSAKELAVLEGHRRSIWALTTLADGHIVSAGYDNELRVWSSDTLKHLVTLEGHRKPVNTVAALDDVRVISGSEDGTLRIWDTRSGEQLGKINGRGQIWAVVVRSDGRVVSGARDGTLRVWNIESGELLETMMGHTDRLRSLARFPDDRIVSGADDSTLRLWTDAKSVDIGQHGGRVLAVDTWPDGRILCGGRDNTVRIWSSSGELLASVAGLAGFHAVAVSDPTHFVAGDHLGNVWFVELEADPRLS